MAKCVICKMEANEEYPTVVYGRNPVTFRNALMHYECYCEELMALKDIPSKQNCFNKVPKYKNRFEEYLEIDNK